MTDLTAAWVNDFAQQIRTVEKFRQGRFARLRKADLPRQFELRSAIDQIYRATGKANDGQIVRQDLREQTFNALARFHKILRRAREHGELSALRRAAARQIDVEPGLSIELPHQAFFVSGFEVPVIRHGQRRGMIETGEQKFNRLIRDPASGK